MSRSRKAPIWTQGYKGTWRKVAKRLSNKKVRNQAKIANGKSYKKIYESWNIVDFKFVDKKNPKARRK